MTSGFRYVRQEGQTTMNTAPVLVHSVPTDLLLNTARMRDAVHMEKLRVPIDPALIQLDNAIHEGAAVEIDVRKAVVIKAKDDEEKEKAKVVKAQEKLVKAKEKQDKVQELAKEKDAKAADIAARKKEREDKAIETQAGIALRKKIREEKAIKTQAGLVLRKRIREEKAALSKAVTMGKAKKQDETAVKQAEATQVIPTGGVQAEAGPSNPRSRVASLRSAAKVNYRE